MKPQPPPLWRVKVERHQVAGAIVGDRKVTVPAFDVDGARREAIRMLHAELRLPPWRPFARKSLEHTSAKPAGFTVRASDHDRAPRIAA